MFSDALFQTASLPESGVGFRCPALICVVTPPKSIIFHGGRCHSARRTSNHQNVHPVFFPSYPLPGSVEVFTLSGPRNRGTRSVGLLPRGAPILDRMPVVGEA